MRNISFALTTPQFKARTKTVTRRMGWLNLKAGDQLMGVEKGMGLKPGEAIKRLGAIRVTSVRREPLNTMVINQVYGADECEWEGFPDLTPSQFVDFFCASHKGCEPHSVVTRIEFEYMEQTS